MKRNGPVLVASAWEPELGPLRVLLKKQRPRTRVVLKPLGVGLVEAAIGATRALHTHTPRALIFIGTAGAYPSAGKSPLQIGSAALIDELHLADLAVARGDAYLPKPLPHAHATDQKLRTKLAAAQDHAVPIAAAACPLGITKTRAAAKRLRAATSAELENLEVFGAARACSAAGVPFAAVLGVSNTVGPNAHAEWKNHAGAATAAAAALIARFLAA